jgi:hypothetical protein
MAVKGNKFVNVALSVALAIIGIVILFSMVSGTWSSVTDSFTDLQNYTGYCVTNATGTYCGDAYADGGTTPQIPLAALVTSSGVIPLVIMAIVVIGVIVGLFALLKGNKGRGR